MPSPAELIAALSRAYALTEVFPGGDPVCLDALGHLRGLLQRGVEVEVGPAGLRADGILVPDFHGGGGRLAADLRGGGVARVRFGDGVGVPDLERFTRSVRERARGGDGRELHLLSEEGKIRVELAERAEVGRGASRTAPPSGLARSIQSLFLTPETEPAPEELPAAAAPEEDVSASAPAPDVVGTNAEGYFADEVVVIPGDPLNHPLSFLDEVEEELRRGGSMEFRFDPSEEVEEPQTNGAEPTPRPPVAPPPELDEVWTPFEDGFADEPAVGSPPEAPDSPGSTPWEPAQPPPQAQEPGPSTPDAVTAALLASPEERPEALRRLLQGAGRSLSPGGMDQAVDGVIRLALAFHEEGDPTLLEGARALATPGVASRLVMRLGQVRDPGDRERLARVAALVGEPAARALVDALEEDRDRGGRRAYLDALSGMGTAGMALVDELLQDPRWFVVRNGVLLVGEMGGEGAVPRLTAPLAHRDPRVRRETVMSLARVGGEDAGLLVAGMLEDAEPEVRDAAVLAVGALRVERALRTLQGMLETEAEEGIQARILLSLGQLGDPGSVPLMEKRAVGSFFSRPPREIRIAAYRGLAAIGTPHARILLQAALDDRDPEVREVVAGLTARDEPEYPPAF